MKDELSSSLEDNVTIQFTSRIRPFKCRLEGCEADFNEMANRNAHEKNVHKYDYKKAMKDLEGAPPPTSQTLELQNPEEYLELSSTSHDQIL